MGGDKSTFYGWCLSGFGFLAISLIVFISLYEFPVPPETETTMETFNDKDSAELSQNVSSALSKFSTSLYQVLAKTLGDSENMFVSPFSVAAVLSMAHAGAKGNTLTQLKSAMHLTEYDDKKISWAVGNLCRSIKGDENYTLESANQMYVANNYQLSEDFQTSLKNHFGAAAENVDFAADETRININKWVENFTHQRIKDLLPAGSVNGLTKLALVNAVYFKGNWLQKFDAALTEKAPFYLGSEDKSIDVNMMHIDAKFRSGYIEDLDARVLELPYVGGKLSMFIILPYKIDGLPALESKLTEDVFKTMDENLRSSKKIAVAIPKFKVEAEVQMKEVLIAMGVGDLFDDSVADLSGIAGKKNLYVSEVFHKAFVEINEEGSEAAAATAGVVRMKRSLDVQDEDEEPFVANHPCLLLIRDNLTATNLFLGRLARPPVESHSSDRDEL